MRRKKYQNTIFSCELLLNFSTFASSNVLSQKLHNEYIILWESSSYVFIFAGYLLLETLDFTIDLMEK